MTYGLIRENIISPKDWSFGGITGIDGEVLQEDGQWTDYLPEKELQKKNNVETMACVSFATANAIETLIKRKFLKDKDYSDRFLAKMSNTTKNGNYVSKVCETARTIGMVAESVWKYENIDSWNEFYKEIPDNIKQKAKYFLEEYDLKWEWVWGGTDEMIEALKYSPLTATVYAWGMANSKGIYPKTELKQNHDILVYGYKVGEYWKIYDTYENVYKRLAWDFKFSGKVKFDIQKKSMAKHQFDNNTLIQLVENEGGFGLYLDEKIIVDQLDKVLASWLVRNNGKTDGKVKAVTQEVWNEFPKRNLKGEVVL